MSRYSNSESEAALREFEPTPRRRGWTHHVDAARIMKSNQRRSVGCSLANQWLIGTRDWSAPVSRPPSPVPHRSSPDSGCPRIPLKYTHCRQQLRELRPSVSSPALPKTLNGSGLRMRSGSCFRWQPHDDDDDIIIATPPERPFPPAGTTVQQEPPLPA